MCWSCRSNSWNVLEFDRPFVALAVRLEVEAPARGNYVAISEVRMISLKKQHALPVPVVFPGPNKYLGCYQGAGLDCQLDW